MYAIIDAEGVQYTVAPGDTVRIQKIKHVGDNVVSFDKVLLVSKDETGYDRRTVP